VNSVCIACLFG